MCKLCLNEQAQRYLPHWQSAPQAQLGPHWQPALRDSLCELAAIAQLAAPSAAAITAVKIHFFISGLLCSHYPQDAVGISSYD